MSGFNYRISSKNSRGKLFYFLTSKGGNYWREDDYLRGAILLVFQILLSGSCAKNIFCFIIPYKLWRNNKWNDMCGEKNTEKILSSGNWTHDLSYTKGIITSNKLNMGFFSPNFVPWLSFTVNIVSARAWIITDQFCFTFILQIYFCG